MDIVYKCNICDLKFNSPSIESVSKFKKRCIKCATYYSTRPLDTPLNLPKHNISLDNVHKTCKRCGVIVKRELEVCPVCSCVEFIGINFIG